MTEMIFFVESDMPTFDEADLGKVKNSSYGWETNFFLRSKRVPVGIALCPRVKVVL